MEVETARSLLMAAPDDEGPVLLPRSVLKALSVADLPARARFKVGTLKAGVIHPDWHGEFYADDGQVTGEAIHTWTRKYWYSPLGLEQYLDLVRRAVEVRQRLRGDVIFLDHDDDGAYIHLRYAIRSAETDLDAAFDTILAIDAEVREAADHATDEVSTKISEIAARLSDWGSTSTDGLLNAVGAASSADAKGRALEELCARLFAEVPGFTIQQRIRTQTEEIDIAIINGSGEPRLSREGALVLVECKNWSGRCGKNEFVLFQEKMRNRSRRCTLGFLVSWNGFAGTVTKEMLRGSHEELLIVPISGADLRVAVRDANAQAALLKLWDRAVLL